MNFIQIVMADWMLLLTTNLILVLSSKNTPKHAPFEKLNMDRQTRLYMSRSHRASSRDLPEILKISISEAERECGAKVDSSPWAAYCGVNLAYYALETDGTTRRHPDTLFYLQGMLDCVYSPCPGDVQAFVHYNRSVSTKRASRLIQFARRIRDGHENRDVLDLFKALMVADGKCMMLYYGQAPQTIANGVRRRNTRSVLLETFARKRRLVDFASAFMQCVSSRLNVSNLSEKQSHWFNSWVAGFIFEQTALCANAPNPSTI